MYDVAVIGAGVVGGMIARFLSEYKLNICIIEKENDVAMGASKANSAIVHAGFDAKEGSLKAKLNVEGSEMMPEIARQLGVKYKNNGSLVLGFNDEDRIVIESLYKRGVKNGVKKLKIIEKDELKSLEPNISNKAICALYAPTGAIICPYELTIAAVGNAMDNGAELFLNFDVTNIKAENDCYEICSEKSSIKSRYVINAAGIYADKIAKMVGDFSFNIHPRRGEYILLDKELGGIVSHTIFKTPSKMGKGILVSPTVDNNLLLGPTSEDITDRDDKSTTYDGLLKIMNESNKYAEKIMLNKSITSFCGLRAVGDTGDFIINMPKERFINVAAIESPGLSSSPAIAKYVVDMIGKNEPLSKKESFNPLRKPMHYFKDASIEKKNEIIKKNKSFGKIVCRCESVTEGEILEAIRTNPKATDLDGIKRRTRAQMGRCQGGFCMPHIAKLLSKEYGIGLEKVTKTGKNSNIVTGRTKGGNESD